MAGYPIIYQQLAPALIAYIKTHVDRREDIHAIIERLHNACGDCINGDPIVIFHGGAVQLGYLVEVAFPVKHMVEIGEVHSRILEAAPALTVIHQGGHETIRGTVLTLYEYLGKFAWTTSLFRREIYRIIDTNHPENNVTEVQMILHKWDEFLAEGAEKVLGNDARQKIMQGKNKVSQATTFDEFTDWIRGAIDRLDELTGSEEQKCQVVSHCAHVFPQERIDFLREIYLNREFDDILRHMYTDDFWYEKPTRRGNIIYMRKNPFNPEGYASAKTDAERRKAYCHCPFVHPYLDNIPSRLSPTFCYCGAGWYRRLWEGIIGQPVKIEHVETLLRGNQQCTLTIILPLALLGECAPED